MRRFIVCIVAAILAASFGNASTAQVVISQFDENTVPTNPENGFGSFTFGDFGTPGAVTDGPTSLILDIEDNDGSNGVFGGIGVDFNLRNFDPAFATWEMRVKKLENNLATVINTTYRDEDILGSTGEEYQFNFDLASVPDDGEFHVLTAAADSPGFSQTAFGFGAGDGENNPGLTQMQIQSAFGSTGRLHVEVDYVRITTPIPEPSSLVLLTIGGLALAGLGRRR